MIPQHLQPKRKTSRSFSFSFSSLFRSWYGLIGFLLIVFLFLLPIIRLVWLSISSEDGISLAMYEEVLSDFVTWKTVQNTLIITVGSTIIALVIGVYLLGSWPMSILGGKSGSGYLSSCHLLSLLILQRWHGFNSLEITDRFNIFLNYYQSKHPSLICIA